MENIKYRNGIGVDVGTNSIVVSRQTIDGNFVNKLYKNALYPLDNTSEAKEMVEKSNYLYIINEDKIYVCGQDAYDLSCALGTDNVIFPMQLGLLNPKLTQATDLLFFIIKAIVDKPLYEKEILCYTSPANPIDNLEMDNVFHKMVLNGFFTKLGYSAKSLNEATCINFDSNGIMKTKDGDIPLTALTISCGCGMWNVSLSLKGLNILEFSCTKSGRWLDESVSKVTGVSKSKIMKIKENEFDLNDSNPDRIHQALKIFYNELITRMLTLITNKFKDISSSMEGDIELILAGGVSQTKGFCNLFEQKIKEIRLPFKIYRIRLADQPLYSPAQGACLRAISYNKV